MAQYFPLALYKMDGVKPLLIYIHGGGFFFSAPPMAYKEAKRYSEELDYNVAMPDYITSDEKPYPYPFLDVRDTLLFFIRNRKEYDISEDIYIAGDSAGGALAIELTLNDVISVLLDLDGDLAERIAGGGLDSRVTASADAHVTASIGSQFLQSVINIQQSGEIYEINSWIKENFRDSFTVEELAEKRNMSVSQFHQKFKNAVGMGPLQCQKRLRLTEGRRLMLDEGKNATEAALDVGYESPSQFIRDYRKMFSRSPKEEILSLRDQLEK